MTNLVSQATIYNTNYKLHLLNKLKSEDLIWQCDKTMFFIIKKDIMNIINTHMMLYLKIG